MRAGRSARIRRDDVVVVSEIVHAPDFHAGRGRPEDIVEQDVVVRAVVDLNAEARARRVVNGIAHDDVVVGGLVRVPHEESDAALGVSVNEVVPQNTERGTVEVDGRSSTVAVDDVVLHQPVRDDSVPAAGSVRVDLEAVRQVVVRLVATHDRVVGRVRNVDPVLGVVVDFVVLNEDILGKTGEDTVVPSGGDAGAVAVATAVLHDVVGGVRPGLVAEGADRDARARGAGHVEAVDGGEAHADELHAVVGIVASRRRRSDLGPERVLRADGEAVLRVALPILHPKTDVRAVGHGDRVTGLHRVGGVLEGGPWCGRGSGRAIVASRRYRIVGSPSGSRPAKRRERGQARQNVLTHIHPPRIQRVLCRSRAHGLSGGVARAGDSPAIGVLARAGASATRGRGKLRVDGARARRSESNQPAAARANESEPSPRCASHPQARARAPRRTAGGGHDATGTTRIRNKSLGSDVSRGSDERENAKESETGANWKDPAPLLPKPSVGLNFECVRIARAVSLLAASLAVVPRGPCATAPPPRGAWPSAPGRCESSGRVFFVPPRFAVFGKSCQTRTRPHFATRRIHV